MYASHFQIPYHWSRAFLARLQQDPTWPPWIATGK
jgi:hypothetical protein